MNQQNNIKRLVLLSFMVALSAVGAYIIIPSPIGTVALDSAPGYLSSLLFGGISGGIVLFLGHLISAMKIGFPLGIIHLLISVLMGGCGMVFSYLSDKINLVISSIIVIILNGVVITALVIPFLGYAFFLSMVGPLVLGSAVNVILAGVIRRILEDRINLNKLNNEGSYNGKN